MALTAALPFIQTGLSIFGAVSAKNAGDEAAELAMQGGELSKGASYANAADAERLGAINAGAITGAAKNNAEMMRTIGYANAQAIADSSIHNLRMYNIQSQEEIRLHKREERWHAGEIRAMQGSSGVMVNSGSPLAYLNAEIEKGIEERHYMQTRDAWAMLGLAEDGLRQSLLTVQSANYNAKVTQDNAALQASVTIAEATAQAAAMRRQGDISAQVGVANAQAARSMGTAGALSAIGNAAGYAGNAYAAWKNTQSPVSYSGSTFNWSTTGSTTGSARKYY